MTKPIWTMKKTVEKIENKKKKKYKTNTTECQMCARGRDRDGSNPDMKKKLINSTN